MGFHGDSSVPEEGGIGVSFIPVESVRIEVRCASVHASFSLRS